MVAKVLAVIDKSRDFPSKIVLTVYAGWIGFLTVGYYAATAYHINAIVPWVWLAIGLSGVTAILYGVWRYRPAAWLGWIFLALANLLFVTGDTHYNVQQFVFGRPNEFPSIADAFYLLTYPLFVAGIGVFVRRRLTRHSERGALLDGAIFTLGLAMLIWQYMVIPNATADTSTLAKVASIAYPLGDILVWAMLVRLWMTDSRSRPVIWLGIGALGLIASDVAYGISQFYGNWDNGTVIDLGWILFYACWGVAALHPSMKELDKVVVKRSSVRTSRLVTLAATALIAPLMLLVESARGMANQVAATVAVFSAVLFVLVILRMYTLVHTISRREADVVIERQKNEIYATIAHQLKAPATRVKVVLSMLGTGAFGEMPDRQHGYIVKASKANEDLLTIIEETLIITRAESGLLKVPPAVVNVRELIDTALGEQTGQIEAKRLVVEKEFPKGACLIQVNLKHLSMAVNNLLENAIKYTPTGGKISIQAKRHPNSVSLSFTDTGEGIASEELPKIFDRFYRSPEQIELTEGTGIGLYLVKQVVSLNGGKVSVRSKKGHGATFTMELPAADVTGQATGAARPQVL